MTGRGTKKKKEIRGFVVDITQISAKGRNTAATKKENANEAPLFNAIERRRVEKKK